MQFKAILIALTFGAIALAAPADANYDAIAREDLDLVNAGFMTPADIEQCRNLDRRYQRRECREDRNACRERG